MSYIIVLVLIIFSGSFFFVLGPRQRALLKAGGKKAVSLHYKKSYLIFLASVLVIGLLFIFLEERLGNLPIGHFRTPGRTAVLRGTIGYRVPDYMGVVNDYFDEGQPVIVSDFRGDYRSGQNSGFNFDWFYAEAPDGRSGWVPREAVITY